ncbi:MAG TPA: secretion protein HlyD [Rhodospirillaceae bacterium]|nr:secretion protein HlyD [Rhodospirillaceae bacterium]
MNRAPLPLIAAFLALILPLGGCDNADSDVLNGYVESETVLVAATSAGLLESLSVQRGQNVKAGQPLFSLNLATLKAELAAADAERLRANATQNDLSKGKRPEEIDIVLKQRDEALAIMKHAEQELERAGKLIKSKAISQAQLDSATSAFNEAAARVATLEAQNKADSLGARADQITAAHADVHKAEQNYIAAERRLIEAIPLAPADGIIDDTYFNQGEYVQAGKPVVSLLPAGNVKVRFFVPESRLNDFPAGEPVMINCDGCPAPVPAKVSFIAPKAEYTPPVIYSVGSRDKLVFLVEAEPDAPSSSLHTGLPVDVRRVTSP